MRNLLLIIGIVFAAQVGAEGGIYRGVGPDGETAYSDQPSPGSVEIEKKEIPTVPATVPQPPPPGPQTTGGDPDAVVYQRLEIIAPEDDAVVWDDQGHLSVNVVVEPELATRNGHELVLYIDGAEAARSRTPGFQLTDVIRGTYSLSVAVVDRQDRELQRSPQISFHMKQHSVMHPRPQAPGTMPGPGGVNPGSTQPGGNN